jgi:hypothetical protein
MLESLEDSARCIGLIDTTHRDEYVFQDRLQTTLKTIRA